MEHAASPSLIALGLTVDPSSENSSIRWGLAASCALHALVLVMAMFVRFQSESEQPFRTIDVALISLPAMPATSPSPKPVVSVPKKKAVVAQPPQKVVPPPPAPIASPVEDTLPPLPTESALERLSESLDGAINSIVVPPKREAVSTPIPSQKPNLQPSEDQSPLLENIQLPSAPPTIARPERLQRREPLKAPSTPTPPSTPVQKKAQATKKPPSQPSPNPASPTPKVQPAVKPAPAIPSLSEVAPFKKSLPRTIPLKTLPATDLEESLERSLPDMPTSAPVRRVPNVSRERSTIQPDQKSSTPQVSAPSLVKIPESPQPTPAMSPSSQPVPAMPPPKMTEMVKKLMEGLKSPTRTLAPKPAPSQRTQPSQKASPFIKPPPSEMGQRIAKLSIPEVAPVESIKQRLDQIHVQSLSDANTAASRPSPGENRYFAIIEAAINKRWVNPNVPIKNKKVIITFHVEKSGEISRVHVEQSSGNSYYDSTILGALIKANPLPEFPSDLQKSFLNIKFLFTMPEQ